MERSWTVGSAEDLGLALAEVRRSRGLTQTEAATDAGISRTWLAKLETGRSTRVLDHFLRVLRRMGATVTVSWTDELAAGRHQHGDGVVEERGEAGRG
jgi:transcriptional regulator with XRE-family HTH domain